MSREDNIYILKQFIEDYEDESRELTEMVYRWNHYDDPGSDPGLQYEQEMKVEKAYNKIVEFIKTL